MGLDVGWVNDDLNIVDIGADGRCCQSPESLLVSGWDMEYKMRTE
jgi:hypothetical protein